MNWILLNAASAALLALAQPTPVVRSNEPLVTTSELLLLGSWAIDHPDGLGGMVVGDVYADEARRWFPTSEIPRDLRRTPTNLSGAALLEASRPGGTVRCRILRPSGEPRLDRVICPRLSRHVRLPLPHAAPGSADPLRAVFLVSWRTGIPPAVMALPAGRR